MIFLGVKSSFFVNLMAVCQAILFYLTCFVGLTAGIGFVAFICYTCHGIIEHSGICDTFHEIHVNSTKDEFRNVQENISTGTLKRT